MRAVTLPVLLLAALAGASFAAEPPPNVILIIADDLGHADLGCTGATGHATPHLDRMAAAGARFTSFYAAQAVCSASRAAFLTGCYPNRVSILGALGPRTRVALHENEVTIAEVLRPRGYATAAYGKWHLGDDEPHLPLRQGFDDYFGLPYSNDMWPFHPERPEGYPPLPLIDRDRTVALNPDQSRLTAAYTERAVKFIEANRDRPFFLYLAHSMPHVPLFASEGRRGKSERGLFGDVIEDIDASVGEVLASLARLGLEERTLVIFTSDNGPWLSYGDHAGSAGPLREGKGTTFEGGVRVPFIARWPGRIPAGAVIHEPAAAFDLLPTISGLAGAALPADRIIDGRDILPLLSARPEARTPHEAIFFWWDRELQAVRSGAWKLHFPHEYRSLEGPGGTGGIPSKYVTRKIGLELFDLAADPGETRDVAAAHPDVVARLQTLAERAREDLGDSAEKRPGKNVRPAATIAPEPTVLGIQGSRFTLGGEPAFLLGASYYGGLGASSETVARDLRELKRSGFRWIRVWATWAAFGADVSAVEPGDGRPREPFLSRLVDLVAMADERGMVVDVTLSRGNGRTGPPRLQTLEAHRRAVETVVAALAPRRNWYLDLSNERNIADKRFTSFDDLRVLRDAAKKLKPDLLITASHAGDISKEELADYLSVVDFISPHRPRHGGSAAETEAVSRRYLDQLGELGRVVPLHYQEPFRRGFGGWAPGAGDFIADLAGARARGAAGWCFHNGAQDGEPEGRPRRSFDLRADALFAQLDVEERRFLELLALESPRAREPPETHPNIWVKLSPVAGAPPSPRLGYEGDCVWVPELRVLLRYGGHNQGGGGEQGSEVWTFDPYTAAWSLKEPNTSPPGICCAQQNVYDPAGRRYLRFAGFSGNHGWQWHREIYLNDDSVWAYDPGTNLWRARRPLPAPRLAPLRAASWDVEHGVAVVFGGETSSEGTLVYDPHENAWTRKQPRLEPDSRSGGNMAYDAARRIHILFGAQFSNDPHTWAYDLERNEWRDFETPALPPTDKNDAVLAHDTIHGRVIAIVKLTEGEEEAARHRLETWTLDMGKREWLRANPAREPDPSGNRARVLAHAPELGLTLLENCTHPPQGLREQQVWAYRATSAEAGAEPARAAPARPRSGPRAVEDLVVSVVSAGETELSWTASPGGASAYHVERAVVEVLSEDQLARLGSRTPPLPEPSVGAVRRVGPFARITREPVNGTAYTDRETDLSRPRAIEGEAIHERRFGEDDLAPTGKPYRYAVHAYRVRAVDATGAVGGPSPAVYTFPSAPQQLFAREDGTACRLKWAASPERGIRGYRVYRMDGRYDKEPITRLTPEPATERSFTDPGAGKSTRRYHVVAVDALGQEGHPSSPVWFEREWKTFYGPFTGEWHQ